MPGLCYTCLSQDRNVKILDNVIKSILSEWFEEGGVSNFKVNLDEFKVCWECIAWFLKISKFKHQVFMSQKIRLKFAKKKSLPTKNLSRLSIHTKNVYDNIYEHVEGSSGLDSKNKSLPNSDDRLSNEGEITKKNITRKAVKGKRKLSITLRKNKEKVTNKQSRGPEYGIYEIKQNSTDDNTDESDGKEKDKSKHENVKLDLLSSIFNVRDLSEDVKLRSQPFVLLERGKHKKISNHSKHKHRKRKHGPVSDDLNKKKAKKRKQRDATDVGKKTSRFDTKFTNVHPKLTKLVPNAVTSEDAAPDSSDSNPDLPEIKFTIVHLTEEQMQETREIDRNDRLYGNCAFKCQTCIIGFLEIGQFEKHNKEKHSVLNGRLVCRICDIRFKKKGFLELHQKTHYRSYRCCKCSFEHHRRFLIENHVVKEHGLKPSPVCPDCDMEFDTRYLLVTHYETAHKDRLKSNVCGDRFDSYARVRKHEEVHKEKDEDCEVKRQRKLGERYFDCAQCSSKFLTREALLAHIINAHRLLSHTCALCNMGFFDQIRLNDHVQTEHPEEIPANQVMDKICQICGERFFARSALLDHMRSHTAEKPYQCKTCEKRFAVETLLKKHIQRMHQ